MTVLQRFKTEEFGGIDLGYNGTSIELHYSDSEGLHTLMVRPETLVEILEENPRRVGKETIKNNNE